MRHKPRGPAWWLLPALLPLLAGLFVVEKRAALPPGGHTAAQASIVLFIYGLVWLWLRANTLQLLWSAQGASYRERVTERHGVSISLPRTYLVLRQAQSFGVRARHSHRHGALKAQRVSKKLPASPLPFYMKGGSKHYLDTL
jgi:hypothetical protein